MRTDATGALTESMALDPFGVSSGALPLSLTYTGRLQITDRLMNYRARYYEPSSGRFISEDPIGLRGGDSNLYRYVFNRPIDFTDPTGLAIFDFNPKEGMVGTRVTIQGQSFGDVLTENAVAFGGVPATVVSASPYLLVTEVPAGAPTNSPIEVTIAAATPRVAEFDAYSFDAAAGDIIRIRMVDNSFSSAGAESLLELFDVNGVPLDSNSSERSATIEFTVPATGTYYLLASDLLQDQGITYRISVTRQNIPANITTLAIDDPASNGSIAQFAEFDAYEILVPTGVSVRITMQDSVTSSSGMESQLEVFDAAGALLGSDAAEVSATVDFTAAGETTIYILTSDALQDQGGSYTLSVTSS